MFMGIVKKHTAALFDKAHPSSSACDLDSKLEAFAVGYRQDIAKLKNHYLNGECDLKCPCLYVRDEATRARRRFEADKKREADEAKGTERSTLEQVDRLIDFFFNIYHSIRPKTW